MPLVDERSLVLIISQSGETADTLAALREAKSHGARVISIVNVVGSTIARESDDVLYTWAGPEISVATTKAYSTQLTLIYLLALYIADALGRIDTLTLRHALNELIALPEKIQRVLEQAPAIEQFAQRLCYLDHAYFIGRNLDYAVALEASPEAQRDQLYPFGGVCRGRAQAWHDLSDRAGHLRCCPCLLRTAF